MDDQPQGPEAEKSLLTLVPEEQLLGIDCDYVREEDMAGLWDTINDMARLMSEKGGVGLAAAQVGILKRFFVCRFPDQPKNAYVYFNPSYKPMKSHGKVQSREACLSYPGQFYIVDRYRRIKASYQEWDADRQTFRKREENMDGFKAILFQHETDHQNGKTIAALGEEWTPSARKEEPVDVTPEAPVQEG